MLKHAQTHSGFSLVELAIVLVIIGLITGGILTGQDLIKASELNSVVSDINKFKTAINTFHTKYNSLPGDLNNAYSFWPSAGCSNTVSVYATPGGCNGNGDGRIVSSSSNAQEGLEMWRHLSLAGLIPGNYSGHYAVSGGSPVLTVGTNLPESSISGAGYFVQNIAFYTRVDSRIHFTRPYPTANSVGNAVLTPGEARSIDAKVDDGEPHLGDVLAGYGNDVAVTTCTSHDTYYTGTSTGISYQLSDTSPRCILGFRFR